VKEKKKYSEPKIYDADGDLSKRWYVYFSFRKTADATLVRFPNNIYAPQHLDKKDRLQWLKTIQRNLSILLKDGFNPYNPENKFDFDNEGNPNQSINEAFEFALNIKKNTLAETSYKDRKSTRLNSSHITISYAVFCLKKKKIIILPLFYNLLILRTTTTNISYTMNNYILNTSY